MGKLSSLTTVKSAHIDSFVYTPPDKAFGAVRTLVLADAIYPTSPPAMSPTVIASVLRGLRRANPRGRIVIVEGNYPEMIDIYQERGLLDDEMRITDVDDLLMREYSNPLSEPVKFKTLIAPEYLAEYDCVISFSTFKVLQEGRETYVSASTRNLVSALPRAPYSDQKERDHLYDPSITQVLQDVHATLGQHFHGAIVDLSHKFISPMVARDEAGNIPVGRVIWGDDMLSVDETACRLANEPVPPYIRAIRQQQSS